MPGPEKLRHYLQYREISREVTGALIESLPREALFACGRSLGVYEEETLYLEEEELPLFFDFCLFHHRIEGQNVVERAIDEMLFPAGSDGFRVLTDLANARPALLGILDTTEGEGFNASDVLRDEEVFVMDQGLSEPSSKGLVFGGHLVPVEDYHMTSGAPFPLDDDAMNQVRDRINRWSARVGEIDWQNLSTERSDRLAGILFQAALDHDVMSHMRYT